MPLILAILGIVFAAAAGNKKPSTRLSSRPSPQDLTQDFVSGTEALAGQVSTPIPEVIPITDSLHQDSLNPYPQTGEDFRSFAATNQKVEKIIKATPAGELLAGVKAVAGIFGMPMAPSVDLQKAAAMYGTNKDGSVAFPTAADTASAKEQAAAQWFGIDQSKPIFSLTGITKGFTMPTIHFSGPIDFAAMAAAQKSAIAAPAYTAAPGNYLGFDYSGLMG